MKVKCVSNYPTEAQVKRLGPRFVQKQIFDIPIGKEYVVFGLEIDIDSVRTGNGAWVFILTSPEIEVIDTLFTPPLFLFEIIDPMVSRYWEMRESDGGFITFEPPSFYRDHYFEEVYDGDPKALTDAYFCSPFEKSAILVADTFGSKTLNGTEAESGFQGQENKITPILKNYQSLSSEEGPNWAAYYSLTYVYNFMSLALGFWFTGHASGQVDVSEAGKTMGLASYGQARPEWPAIVKFRNDRIETDAFTRWALDRKIARIRKGRASSYPQAQERQANPIPHGSRLRGAGRARKGDALPGKQAP